MSIGWQLVMTWGAVYLINLVPAFMPPTWSVLAFFLIHFDLPLLPLSLGGAAAATAGRLTLALAARRLGPRLVPADTLRNLTDLGTYLRRHERWIGPAVLLYSFGPIPSNQLFIAAGLAGVDLRMIGGAFFVGRIISYTVFAHTAERVVDNLPDVFGNALTSPPTILLEVASLAILVAIAKMPWGRLLGIHGPESGAHARTGAVAAAPPRDAASPR